MLNLNKHKKSQQGIALFVSLVFLLILTLIGITAMKATLLQEKMAGNCNEQNRAIQASEVALREAENWMQGLVAKPADLIAPNNAQVWRLMDGSSDHDVGGIDNCSGGDMWWRQCSGQWWTDANAANGNPVQAVANLTNIKTKPFFT